MDLTVSKLLIFNLFLPWCGSEGQRVQGPGGGGGRNQSTPVQWQMSSWALPLFRTEWKMLAADISHQDTPTVNATPLRLGATCEAALDSLLWLIKQSGRWVSFPKPAGGGMLKRVESLWRGSLWLMRLALLERENQAEHQLGQVIAKWKGQEWNKNGEKRNLYHCVSAKIQWPFPARWFCPFSVCCQGAWS